MRIALDMAGEYALLCTPHDGRLQLRLSRGSGDTPSPLHRVLHRLLRFRSQTELRQFNVSTDVIEVRGPIQVDIGTGPAVTVASVSATAEVTVSHQLSPFECRYMAEYGRVHPLPPGAVPTPALTTDLHSHFAGCVRAPELVSLGIDHNISFPAHLLAEIGGTADADQMLATLSRPIVSSIERQLEVPGDRCITFLEMERIYRLRSPLTKARAMFVPLLQQIATDYASMGVDYVELSLGDICSAARLRAVHAHVPAIEEATGVRLRFLAAMSRHDDLEWDLDYIDRIAQLARSRYIVGVDFMGHESNSTTAFARQIRDVAEWAHRERPGFAVRVHAGENPAHPENVRVALDCVRGCDVQLRIGHGLYGADEATVERLATTGTIVEFNLNSNFALNNIQSLGEAPIHRYIRSGVPVVLGSDGYGIYRTSPVSEARAAWLCGLDDADFITINACERRYVAARMQWDSETQGVNFQVPDDVEPVHFNAVQISKARRERRRSSDERLRSALDLAGAELLSRADFQDLSDARRCFSLAGSWRRSWSRLSSSERAHAEELLRAVVNTLVPGRDLLLSGGTMYGVEGVVAPLARTRGLEHVAVVVRSTPSNSLASGCISHAVIAGDSLHDKAGLLYSTMRRARGLCVFIGGGNIVSDEIQTARNLRLRYLLSSGVSGASRIHGAQLPQRTFSSVQTLRAAMQPEPACTHAPSLRYQGANPSADIVLTRRNPTTRAHELLLLRRALDTSAEAGTWALPGGFIETNAEAGQSWQAGHESAREAVARELYEESGIDLRGRHEEFTHIGDYERGGRDPRDTVNAFVRSSVFSWELPNALASLPTAGADDAMDARWFSLDELPLRLGFDHWQIIRDTLGRLLASSRQ